MKQKRKKLGRKLLSFLLTLAMMVGLMPGMGMTVYAAEETITLNSKTDTLSAHGIQNLNRNTGYSHVDFENGELAWGTFVAPSGKVFTKIEVTGIRRTGTWNWTGSANRVDHDNFMLNPGANSFTITFTLDDAHTHVWAEAWSNDATYHWHACTGEGATDACLDETAAAKAEHSYGDTGNARFTCTVCGYVDTTKQEASDLADAKTEATNTVNAVEAEDYIEADQQTVTNAKSTALAAIEAATTTEAVNTALETFNTAIANCTTQAVADQIAQVMSEVSARTGSGMTYTGNPIQLINTPTTALPIGYTMKYVVTTDNTAPTDESLYTTSIPTKTDAGTYYVWYKVVGDENHTDTEPVMLKVTIDVAQGETKIETEVQTDEKSPKLEASNLTKEVAESTLTDEEKEDIEKAVNNGKDVDVDVYLAIRDIADEITAEDKAKLEAEASDAGQLAYFDISLFKEIIVDGTSLGATAISELQKPLKLAIGVPNSFPAVETGYTRTYTVLRLHKGEVTTLPTTVNADGTISFETDRFSVYALVYKDTKEATTTEATTASTTEVTTEATTATTEVTTTAAASTSDATTASAKTAAEEKTAPKTGDSMPIAVMVVLMFAAAGMLVFMDLKKKKN